MKGKSMKKDRMLRKDDYIVEAECYVVTRWGEQNNPTHDSELVHHLKDHLSHSFNWFIIANASSNKWTRRNSEAIYIALKRCKLNGKVKHNKLVLF